MSDATIAHWEVTRAKNAGQKPNLHGGQFDKWYVGLKNLDGGTDCDDAYWQRKSPSEVTVGDKVYGKVENGDYGDRFYLEKDEEGARQFGSSEAKTSNTSKGSSGETDWEVRNAEIRRQHSQQVAIELCSELGVFEPHHVESAQAELVKWADFFDQDAIAAGQKAQGGVEAASFDQAGTPDVSSSPQPSADLDFTGARKSEPQAPVTDLDDYRQLLDSAGLVYAAARDEVAEYMALGLSKERLNKALSGLQDLDRQGAVMAQLKTETVKWTGRPLPQGDALDGADDVPF